MEEKLTCAMDIGEHLLTSGAEIHRVEESIERMCRAFGVKRVDVFIITSSMVVTIFDQNDNTYTQTRRITGTTTDFEKIHRLNALSRKICSQEMTVAQIRAELAKAIERRCYPFWLECICYSVIAGAFTLFFGGDLTEALVSLAVGLLVRLGCCLFELAIPN